MRPAKSGLWSERKLYSHLIHIHVLYHASHGEVGPGLMQQLAKRGYKLSSAALHSVLRRLEKGGLLRSHKRAFDGTVLHSYRATASGRKALASATGRIRELLGEITDHRRRSPKRRA